jgi:cyclopropane fatty-acyl-phospholipid synthase-like methyltransferase
MEKQHFESMYEGRPPWDIGRPQRAIMELEEAGHIRGSVLDAGCGTGENALYLASRGHDTWGVDYVRAAIDQAQTKAHSRAIPATFAVADALALSRLGRQFDTVIDCGLFHTFSDEERAAYVAELAQVVPHGGVVRLLCFSEQEPGDQGPRRVTQQEIRDAFNSGWRVQSIKAERFEASDVPGAPAFSPGGPKAWLATIVRVETPRS